MNPLTAVWYAPLNVNLPPFNDLRVRKALNYAIDRDALVGMFGGVKPCCARLSNPAAGLSRACRQLPIHC